MAWIFRSAWPTLSSVLSVCWQCKIFSIDDVFQSWATVHILIFRECCSERIRRISCIINTLWIPAEIIKIEVVVIASWICIFLDILSKDKSSILCYVYVVDIFTLLEFWTLRVKDFPEYWLMEGYLRLFSLKLPNALL